MQCPINSCKSGWTCLRSGWLFLVFLLLVVIIGIGHLNQSLFYTINNMYAVLPDFIWSKINLLAYTKYGILVSLLFILTLLFRRQYLLRVVLLIFTFYLVFWILKHVFHEARPYMVLPVGSFHFLTNYEEVVKSAYRSFPSGHTGQMAIFVFAVIKLFFPRNLPVKIILFLLLLLTGFTRICTGWHWPLDVISSGLISYILVQIFLCNKSDCAK